MVLSVVLIQRAVLTWGMSTALGRGGGGADPTEQGS